MSCLFYIFLGLIVIVGFAWRLKCLSIWKIQANDTSHMYFVLKLLFEDAIYKVSSPVSAYMEACKHSGEPKLTWGSSELIFPKKKKNQPHV